jgi:hypothetical protein
MDHIRIPGFAFSVFIGDPPFRVILAMQREARCSDLPVNFTAASRNED